MGVSAEALAHIYANLYHLTSEGSWPNILKHGLLSTEALLDLFQIVGKQRERILASRRPECVTIDHQKFGRAVIRDQKPLVESRLREALLDGMTPRDWYVLLNRRVFFWVAESRLETLRSARAYRGLRQTVIVVDCARLLSCCADRVTLCAMNSGATRPFAFPRGRDTFLPIAQYPFDEFRRKRGLRKAVVELAVDYSIPNIGNVVKEVREIGGPLPERKIWP